MKRQKTRLEEADLIASEVYGEMLNGKMENCLQEAVNLQVTVNRIVFILNQKNNRKETTCSGRRLAEK